MKLKIKNAELLIKLRRRNGFWEFIGVLEHYAFDTEQEATNYLKRVFGKQVKISKV